jgi:hypothetical protein
MRLLFRAFSVFAFVVVDVVESFRRKIPIMSRPQKPKFRMEGDDGGVLLLNLSIFVASVSTVILINCNFQ